MRVWLMLGMWHGRGLGRAEGHLSVLKSARVCNQVLRDACDCKESLCDAVWSLDEQAVAYEAVGRNDGTDGCGHRPCGCAALLGGWQHVARRHPPAAAHMPQPHQRGDGQLLGGLLSIVQLEERRRRLLERTDAQAELARRAEDGSTCWEVRGLGDGAVRREDRGLVGKRAVRGRGAEEE